MSLFSMKSSNKNMKKDRLRERFYIAASREKQEAVYTGMVFSEFVKYVPQMPNHLILLESNHIGSNLNTTVLSEIVHKESIGDLLQEDIYNYGDFCWIDTDTAENIDRLEPLEVAELFYLGRKKEPVTDPFFDKLQNRYAYLAHDDGWFCRLYARHFADIGEIIAHKTTGTVAALTARETAPLPEEIKSRLLAVAEEGLLMDFGSLVRGKNKVELPVYAVGKMLDMDKIDQYANRLKAQASYSARLCFTSGEWSLNET